MTKHSICFAGLSREEEAVMTICFKQASAAAGNGWQLASESEAAVLVIDMDSMYGQMSLMKALGSDKVLVSLTSGGQADTDYVLSRRVTVESISQLLSQIESRANAAAAGEASVEIEAPPTDAKEACSDPPTELAPETLCARPAEPHLVDYLRPGALAGPVRLRATGAPDLVLDPATRTYFGASALKPLLPYCNVVLHESDLAPVDASELPTIAATLGGSQPWSRLAWLCALSGRSGVLADGFGLNDKYKLLKWPQTEREFPKHFRIATVMMKGPAILTDIAEQSGGTLAEVIDFVNAFLATGVVEPELPPAPSVEIGKGSLLGRFRR